MTCIKRISHLVDTNGHCFLCVSEIGEKEQQKQHSLHSLSRYLKISFRNVLKNCKLINNTEGSSIPSPAIDVNVILCEKCDHTMTKLSDTLLVFQFLQMEMDDLIKSVQKTIAESNGNLLGRWKKMNDSPAFTFQMDIANELRILLLKKCSGQTRKVRPVVVAQKLSKEYIKSSNSKEQNPTNGSERITKTEVPSSESSSDDDLFIPIKKKSKSVKTEKIRNVSFATNDKSAKIGIGAKRVAGGPPVAPPTSFKRRKLMSKRAKVARAGQTANPDNIPFPVGSYAFAYSTKYKMAYNGCVYSVIKGGRRLHFRGFGHSTTVYPVTRLYKTVADVCHARKIKSNAVIGGIWKVRSEDVTEKE